MGIAVTISEAAKAQADVLVASGHYTSIEQAIEAGLQRLDDDWNDDEDPSLLDLSPEDREAVAEGFADARAGRVIQAEQVYAELRARFGKTRA